MLNTNICEQMFEKNLNIKWPDTISDKDPWKGVAKKNYIRNNMENMELDRWYTKNEY